MSPASSIWFFFLSQTRTGSPSTQLPGPWLVTNDSHMRGSGRASQGPHSYLEGPGVEELLQLQGQPLNLCLNHGTSPPPGFVVGLVWVYAAPVLNSLYECGVSSRVCAAQMFQRHHGLRTHLSLVQIPVAGPSVAWSCLPSKAFLFVLEIAGVL